LSEFFGLWKTNCPEEETSLKSVRFRQQNEAMFSRAAKNDPGRLFSSPVFVHLIDDIKMPAAKSTPTSRREQR
jgi:hypothetical protein